VLGSLFLTTGDTSYISQTVIDGDSVGSVVTFESGEDSTALISGFTIWKGSYYFGGGIFCSNSSPRIIYNTFTRNHAYQQGAGIYCYNSNPIISNNTLISNQTNYGGAIFCHNSSPLIENNYMIDNYAEGGGIYCFNSNPSIYGNKIRGNIAYAGGGIDCRLSNPVICNNTFWGNVGIIVGGIYCENSSPLLINNTFSWNSGILAGGLYSVNSAAFIANTIFWEDGNAGVDRKEILAEGNLPTIIYCNIHDSLWPGEGNIDIDPLFRDPDNGDFHLVATYCGDPYDSPCIDAGHPDILDSLLDCGWGLGELRSDMGAYGGGDSVQVGIDDQEPKLPIQFSLSQNYPNPFNASTTISYTLPCQSDVTLDIYDILGRKVQTLVSRNQPAGYHRVIWQANEFTSGIYFYKLQAGEYIETKKMMLLR